MTDPVTLTCHCGAVELRATLSQPVAEAIRCDCSFCRRRGAPMVTAPLDGIEVLRGGDKLTLYQFNTGTARHYFCAVCGIYMYHRRRSNPNEHGVNMGAIDGVNPRDYDIAWMDGVNHPSDR